MEGTLLKRGQQQQALRAPVARKVSQRKMKPRGSQSELIRDRDPVGGVYADCGDPSLCSHVCGSHLRG